MKSIRLTPCAAAVAAAVLQMSNPAYALDCTLTTNGLWQTPSDWSCNARPGSGDSATITVSGLVTVNQDEQITTLGNAGTINIASNSLTLLGGGSTTNSGTINVGTVSAGTLNVNNSINNTGGTINVRDGSTVNVNNATIGGGTLATLGSGTVSLANSAFLDAVTHGAMTLSGNIVSATNQTNYIAGTFTNNGNLTVGVNSDLILQSNNNVTLNGTGTVTLLADNSRFYGANGADLLTIGSGQTVQGVGQLGANQTRVANSGLITANQSGGTFRIDPTDGAGGFTNTGTLRAENGGTLLLINGTYTNAGGTIAALAGSGVSISGATIQGGTVSTTGTGNVAFSNSSVIDGSSNGAVKFTGANITVADNQTVYALGTINGSFAVNTNADLRIQNTNNLTLTGGTTTLVADNARIFGDIGTDILTNTATNTIQGRGQVGVNSTFVNNAGVITANIQGATLQLDPSDGDATHGGLTNTGTLRAENGGNLQLIGGYYDNSAGHLTATGTGSTVTITNSAVVQGGVLTATAGGAINLSSNVLLDASTRGAMTLSGPVSIQDNQTVYAIGTLTDNTLTVGNNADLRIQGQNNLTLTGGKTTLTADNSRIFGDSGIDILTNTASNTIQGRGQIGINSTIVRNAGLITANVQGATLQLDPSDGNATVAGLINTGTLRAENGGNLQFIGGFYDNSAGVVTATGAGSTVTLTNGAVLQGGTVTGVSGGAINVSNSVALDGLSHGALTLNGPVSIQDNQTVYGLGTITDNTVTIGNNADFRIQNANNLTLTGGTTTLIADNSRLFGDNNNDVLTNTASNTIQGRGQIGVNQTVIKNAGVITANVQGATLNLDPTDGDSVNAGLVNSGTLRAENGGVLQFVGGHYNNQAGTISALTGSNVNVTNGAVLEGGLLSTTGTGTINFSNSAALDGTAHGAITINGNANILSGQVVYATGSIVNNGTFTQLDNADLHIQGATNLTLSGTGTYVMTAGNSRIFGDNNADVLTNASGHTITGVGQIGVNQTNLTNAGTINANVSGGTLTIDTTAAIQNQASGVLQASNGGLLNLVDAVNGTGTMRSDSGGTVQLGQTSTTGKLINNANLALGTNNVTVSSDYSNANFGTGNSFNKHSNVTGTGQILASGDVTQGITGANVTNGTSATPTLTIGNVRVGGTTYNYQVANNGTSGPALRGAVETTVNGGNVTDPHLSVTPSNYGPVAVGATSGNLGVTYTASQAGLLTLASGQAVHIANNFDNVAEQTMNIVLGANAAAYNTAVGVTTPSPVTVANQRVSGTNTAALTVKNNGAAGNFTEALDASFSGTTGSATTNGGSVSNIAAQASNSSALKVGVDTSTAGAKSGSVTIAYQTDGTGSNGHSGLSAIGAGSQTINVSGNVYNTAVGMTTPTPATVANQHVGGSNTTALTVKNNGAAGSFTEALDASFSGTTGAATGTGSVSNIAAQASNGTALKVGVDTSTAGAKTGTVTIAYQTDGTGSNGNSGLAAIAAGSQNITVSGNVYNLAQSSTIGAINFGLHHVGDGVVSQTVAVTNTAPTGAFSEGLDSSFGAVTGTGASKISTSGVITNLAAGSTDSSTLVVKLDTSTVGMVNGNIHVNQASNGTISGLGNTALAGQNPAVTADVEQATGMTVRYASPKINTTTPVNFGAVRIGTTQSTALSITNNVPNDGFSESLVANVTGSTGKGTGSGGFGAGTAVPALAPSATDTTHVIVGLNTATAGHQTGAVNVDFKSDGTAFAGGGITDLGTTAVGVQGDVYRLANPTVATPTVLAARVGGTAATTIGITNASPDVYTEGLTATRGATTGAFTTSGSITNLAAGQSSNAIGVALNTSTAGTFSGSQALNLVSTGAGTDGAADLALAGQTVQLTGKVYTQAAATLNTPSLNFNIVHVGDTASKNVSVTNSAPVTALNDVLTGSAIGTNNAAFTAAGSLGAGLAAGATSTNALSVGLNTATAGVYNGTATFSAASHDADLSDVALANLAVSLSGTVNNYASDAFTKSSGAGTFSQSGTTFVLDYGTVAQNSGVESTTLAASNTATGPADVLSGSFSFLDPKDFNESGFSSFMDLIAGQSTGPLMFSFDTSTVGSFSDTIVLHGVGSNASGYEGAIGDITLTIRGNVTGDVVTPPGNPIPEPDTLVLLGLGVPLYFLRRARKNARAAKHA